MIVKVAVVFAAFSGALAVTLGAFAAHGLRDKIEPRLMETFQTAVEYQMIHSLALLMVALMISHFGRTLALDALSTGFAFVLYEMLEKAGLKPHDCKMVAVGATPKRWESVRNKEHAGTLTIEPFTSIARAAGFNVLDVSSRLFDAYQVGVIAAPVSRARANADAIRSYIRGYLKGLAWALDPQNREAGASLLLANMPAIKPGVVGAVMDSLLSPISGLTPKGAILRDGMKTVLGLRSRYGEPRKDLTDVDKYLDLSFYDQVTAARA